ncbi:MAG: LUD domain-containing protein [Deltaproteobacteria bacterium]|nr:LUD domain-containing protein [Deltaproteobacteria bacterium]
MAARDEILAAVRRGAGPAVEHPGTAGLGVRFADPVVQFAEMARAVGSTCLRVPDLAAADQALRALPVSQQARRSVSLVPGVGASTFDPAAVAEPHALDGLDLAVFPAGLAVAENAAMWIDTRPFPHQALYVVAEHIAVVVRASTVVHDMHQAYERIRHGKGFALFLGGPSKTADIEQALVVGAHGARSCAVLLVEG